MKPKTKVNTSPKRIRALAALAGLPFEAPPELVQFLFGTTALTDVEFAIEESGVLLIN